MNYQDLIDRITKAILDNVRTALKDYANCDKTYKGRITDNVMSKTDETKKTNRYKVLINGVTHIASSSIECEIGDFVWVTAPCGNISNAFIACKTK